MFTITKIETIAQLEELKPVWNTLASKSEGDSIFITYEWILSWWQAFGDDKKLLILKIENDNEVVGIAPLMIVGDENPIVQFIGTPNADYSDFLGEDKESVIKSVVDYLFENQPDWSQIDLTQIPESSSSIRILENCLTDKKAKFVSHAIENISFFQFEGTEDERKNYSLKMGRSFKRFRNFFTKANGLEFCHITDLTEIEYYLPPFYQCHVTRWNSLGSPGKFLNPKMRKFHNQLAKNLTPLNRLAFFVLKHGDVPLAYLFGYDYNKTINLYNIANESFYQRRSPGILLLHNLIEKFIKAGHNKIDFSRGGGEHKSRFVNKSMVNIQFLIFRSGADLKKHRIKEKVKRTYPFNKILKSNSFTNFRKKIQAIGADKDDNRLLLILKIALSKLISPIFKTYCLGIYKHFPGEHFQGEIDINSEIKRADESMIEEIGNFYGVSENSPKHKIILHRFEQGCDCHILYHNGRIVTIAWGLYKGDYDFITGYELKPGENEVVSSDALTAELYRGRGIRPYLVARVLKKYDQDGISVVGAIDQTNAAQIKSVCKHNNKLVRKIRIIKIFGKSFQINSKEILYNN